MPGPMEGVVASILLQIPFIKHIFGWIGAHPAGTMTPARATIYKPHSHTNLIGVALLLDAS